MIFYNNTTRITGILTSVYDEVNALHIRAQHTQTRTQISSRHLYNIIYYFISRTSNEQTSVVVRVYRASYQTVFDTDHPKTAFRFIHHAIYQRRQTSLENNLDTVSVFSTIAPCAFPGTIKLSRDV